MVIERSRAWVKARIPAFICKETNWWVTRWIQTNVFLCPHCKQEYRSLKKVWDSLDEWEEEQPTPHCEIQFSSKFREQFPSAFRNEEEVRGSVLQSWYGKVGLVGGVVAVGFACMVVLRTDDSGPFDNIPGTVQQSAKKSESPDSSAAQVVKESEEKIDRSSIEPELPSALNERDLISPSETYPSIGSRVRTVSLDNYSERQSNNANQGFPRHVVEINSHPVAGFSALTNSTQEDAY